MTRCNAERPLRGAKGSLVISIRIVSFFLFLSVVFMTGKATGSEQSATSTNLWMSPSALISAGGEHTCAVTEAGVQCWGGNRFGQLGDGTTTNRLMPVSVLGLANDMVAVAAGYSHTCALTTSGGVKCWGRNADGQLGNESTTDSVVPVLVSGLATGVSAISAGFYHTCALKTSGQVSCWGYNASGQLGNGTLKSSAVPVDVSESSTIMAVSVGYDHSCVLTDRGSVKCWGSNRFGQLGKGIGTNPVSVAVSGFSKGVISMTAGGHHTCVLKETKGVKGVQCWGDNRSGQLGKSTKTDPLTAVGLPSVGYGRWSLAAGASHTCALIAAMDIQCWGRNHSGQLGNGTRKGGSIPVAASPASGATPATPVKDAPPLLLSGGLRAITAGFDHTCAVLSDGGVSCWGNNTSGQLGNGNTTISFVPVTVTNLIVVAPKPPPPQKVEGIAAPAPPAFPPVEVSLVLQPEILLDATPISIPFELPPPVDIFFDYDSSDLSDLAKERLTKEAEWYNAHREVRVVIEGYSDSRGEASYNFDLAIYRGQVIQTHLAGMKVAVDQLSVVSYGEERPFCTEQTETCYAENRRVRLVPHQ
ncbi:MAG: OmpA family protein [Nitrospirota bacterium]